MAETSRYGKAVLALTAGFALFCGGWYAAQVSSPQPWQVTAAQRPPIAEEASSREDDSSGPDSLLPGERIDINSADVYDLQRLPGIGEKRARDIITYREEHGPFQTVDQLDEVSGIGPGILEALREYAAVEDK